MYVIIIHNGNGHCVMSKLYVNSDEAYDDFVKLSRSEQHCKIRLLQVKEEINT